MQITHEKTNHFHVRLLAQIMREDDKKEIMSFGMTPIDALELSYSNSYVPARTTFVDGELACIRGCGGNMMSPVGRPWLLTGPSIERIPLTLVKQYKSEVRNFLKLFPVLENYVAAEYTKAIRLLQIAGFSVGDPEPYGKGIFRKFTISRDF